MATPPMNLNHGQGISPAQLKILLSLLQTQKLHFVTRWSCFLAPRLDTIMSLHHSTSTQIKANLRVSHFLPTAYHSSTKFQHRLAGQPDADKIIWFWQCYSGLLNHITAIVIHTRSRRYNPDFPTSLPLRYSSTFFKEELSIFLILSNRTLMNSYN